MITTTTLVTSTQVCLIGAVVLGCATTSRAISDSERAAIPSPSAFVARDASIAPAPARPSDILTAAELAAAPGLANGSLYDAVAQLRPTFLNPRDARTGFTGSPGTLPAVFVNGMLSGGVEALRMIPASAVVEMRYVRSFDAVLRYGPDYGAGIILVRLGR